MNKINTITINSKAKIEFTLKKGEKYFITPFQYTSPDNPMADTIFKPLDSSKIKISTKTVSDAEKITVENELDTGVNIEIYQT